MKKFMRIKFHREKKTSLILWEINSNFKQLAIFPSRIIGTDSRKFQGLRTQFQSQRLVMLRSDRWWPDKTRIIWRYKMWPFMRKGGLWISLKTVNFFHGHGAWIRVFTAWISNSTPVHSLREFFTLGVKLIMLRKISEDFHAVIIWSVHTSANLIFHFPNKNGKRKYYLSLSYLHILKYRKKIEKKKMVRKIEHFFIFLILKSASKIQKIL